MWSQLSRSAFSLASAALLGLSLTSCREEAPEPGALNVDGSALRAADAGTASVDTEALAHRLVVQSANVREGDIVVISGGVRDIELLEDLAVNVRKRGAHPLVTLVSERVSRRVFDDVDPKYDTQEPRLSMKLVEIADVFISVDAYETEGLLAHVPAERRAAQARVNEPVTQLFVQRAVRAVNLGNGMYPTRALAERFGVPQQELGRIFWDGVNVDYAELERRGEALRSALAAGRELHITTPSGTDLRVRIEGRPIFVSDGSISDADRQRGSAGSQVWLPAGEVYLAPVPGTAEGRVVVERHFFDGKEIQNLALTFRGGKLTEMTAASGLEPLKAMYDAAGAGKDEFAFVDFGINPNVRLIPGSRMQAWMPAGMVTVGVGGNTWAGGTNTVPYGLGAFLPGSTVRLDGTVLVENGVLKW